MERYFKKLSLIFCKIYLIKKHHLEINILDNQYHQIICHQRMPKNICKTDDITLLFKGNWARIAEIKQSPRILKSSYSTKLWKILENRLWQSFCSKVADKQLAISIQKDHQQRWFSEWLFCRIPDVHLELCLLSMMESFSKNFQFIIDTEP